MEDPKQNHIGAQYATEFRGNQGLLAQAEMAANESKGMTKWETMKAYRKAVLWSMVLSTALIMEGFDVSIINSFFGQTAFLQRFGSVSSTGQLFIPPNWQSAINNAASVGEVIGLGINGYCQARFGSKRTYLCAMVLMAAAIFLPFFANSLEMLFAGELICGIPWGIFQTLTTAYASEICPISLRGYLTSYVNMCWGLGLSLGAGVVRASLVIQGNWGWRMPYAVQWVWPVPLFVAVLFAPESPWWLVRKHREEEAAKVMQRLAQPTYMTEEMVQSHIAYMKHTIELEAAETEGHTWKEIFKGTNGRRTEITCMVWSAQYLCGQPLTGLATQFLEDAGMDEAGAFDFNLAVLLMIAVGTVISWVFFYRFGRRFLYLMGEAFMAVCFLVMGILGCLPQSNGVALGIGVIMILITFAFGISIAPGCYTIVAEIPSSTVRTQTVVLARMTYVISGLVLNQLFPRFLNPKPDGWAIGGKCGFIFVGINIALYIYFHYRLPETMGRTFGEIDTLFQNRVPARKFATTSVDEFEADRVNGNPMAYKGGDEKGDVAHIEVRRPVMLNTGVYTGL